MSHVLDPTNPGTVAPATVSGEISFFACIAQQEPATQRLVWDALAASVNIFSESQDTDEARRIFTDFLSDNGISIARGYADRLTPEARQLLRDSIDAADILNRYADMSDNLQSKMMLSTAVLMSWNDAETTDNPSAAASYAALHHFCDTAYQIIDGEARAQIEVAEGYNAEEFRQLQEAWNTIESIEKAFLIRRDTQRRERQSETARDIMDAFTKIIDALPEKEQLSAWESVQSRVTAELSKINGGGTNV